MDNDAIDMASFPQEPTPEQAFVAAGSVALSTIPVFGGAAAALWMACFPVLNKRQIAWLEYIGRSVMQTNERLDHLFERPEVLSAFMQASQIALRTAQREKWQMLRNAFLNVVVGKAPEEDLQPALMNLVEALTRCEVQLLRFFFEPQAFGVEQISDFDYPWSDKVGPAKPEALKRVACLHGQSYLYEYFIRHLDSLALLHMPDSTVADVNQEVARRLNPGNAPNFRLDYKAPRASAMAQLFIAFITSPFPTAQDDEDGDTALEKLAP